MMVDIYRAREVFHNFDGHEHSLGEVLALGRSMIVELDRRHTIIGEQKQEIERLKAQVAHLEGMLSESANLGETSMGAF